MSVNRPDYAPVASDFFVISVSVSTIASAKAAGVGPFRGLFFKSTASCTIVSPISGNSLRVSDVAPNTLLWIQGAYVSSIVTATSQYGVL